MSPTNNGGAESYPFTSQKRSLEEGGRKSDQTWTLSTVSFTPLWRLTIIFVSRWTRCQEGSITEWKRFCNVYVKLFSSYNNSFLLSFHLLTSFESLTAIGAQLAALSQQRFDFYFSLCKHLLLFIVETLYVINYSRSCVCSVRPSTMTEECRVPDSMVGLSE